MIAVGGSLAVDPDRPSELKDKRVDWFGSLLITSGLALVTFGLSDGPYAPQGWRTICEYPLCWASSADPHNLGISKLGGADVNLHSPLCTDIIGCLAAGVFLTVLFFCWNAYLSRVHGHGMQGSSVAWWTPPPLIPGNLWLRSNGRLLAILMIVFLTWCSFLSNNIWVRGPPPLLHSSGIHTLD